jgi:hypothetical protein
LARVENVLLKTTTLCGFINPTTSTLDVLKNGVVRHEDNEKQP